MARSKTQKAIRKAERQGAWCYAYNRRSNEDYSAVSQHVRLTPTKQQKLNKVKHRKRIGDDALFLLFNKLYAFSYFSSNIC